jgi:hypothetical protein
MAILIDPGAKPVFFDRVAPKSPGRGLRIVFNEDLFYPASGVSPPTGQFAGTHSGVLTTLWEDFRRGRSAPPSRAAN